MTKLVIIRPRALRRATTNKPDVLNADLDQRREFDLPPVIAGHESEVVVQKVEGFYASVAAMFEAWVARSENYRLEDSTTRKRCIYTPHSLRATTATLLLKAGVNILDVQELLGHRNVTTTQIYDKRIRQTRDSASHKISF